ncbi:hypothetical protein [Flavitalea sp.]|nr:hypothetical protein [Flavitalea sp.]
MERNFYTDDFEELLKEKADQYKMYPSDKVWNGIQSSLHSRRKWYWIGFALLLSGVSYYAIEALIAPPGPVRKSEAKIAASKIPTENVLLGAGDGKRRSALVIPLTQHKISQYNPVSNSIDQPFKGEFDIDRSYSEIEPGATAKVVEMLQIAKIPVISDPGEKTDNSAMAKWLPVNRINLLSGYQPITIIDNTHSIIDNTPSKTRSMGEVTDRKPLDATAGINLVSGIWNLDESRGVARFPMEQEQASEDVKKINWLQEFAFNEFTVPPLKRLSWQLSFAPTMNYRRLSTSKKPGREYMVKNIPIAMNITGDLDNLVNHTPALGFELGSHLRYAANRTVTFKAGIQFNYARYAIEAFEAPGTDVATIALNSVGGSHRDSLISYSSISNFGGNSVKDIQNQYFQLSAPIGVELKLIGGKRMGLHLAGTIQPTYLLNRNTFLITTDYRSYTHEPSLVRRWNMNTSAEAFVSYNTGGIIWQVGPQFRYQVLSSYSSKYPIRENLMEYGVKIGVSKTIR